jgi:pimeloyl-ACP methyl ester carboxylesterase
MTLPSIILSNGLGAVRKGLGMRRPAILVAAALALSIGAMPAHAQDEEGGGRRAVKAGPVDTDKYRTQYIRLAGQSEGLLYQPANPTHPRIALIFTHPSRNNFNAEIGREMASRGYRALMLNYRGDADYGEGDPEEYLPGISQAVTYLRSLPGVEKVILVGHSGGGHLVGLYGGVSEQGPGFCSDSAKIYPCPTKGLEHLARLDGIVFLDSTLGAFHQMSAIDPAIAGTARDARLDMFAAANGYDPQAKRAAYSADFARRFYAGQAKDNARIIDSALARLHAIEAGKGEYSDDEPLVIRGMGVRASGARLYQPDIAFAAHTKLPHTLLRADGTNVETIIQSVRAPSGRSADSLNALETMAQDTTVRRFLAASAIRTAPNYAITADDIIGVDWHSAYNSTPAMAEGISVPALVLTMGCHYLVMPGEIIYDHLASHDKSYASVEGATHGFAPCRPEYGDTSKRAFDYLDGWLSQGRF